jgi:hypothetical protein
MYLAECFWSLAENDEIMKILLDNHIFRFIVQTFKNNYKNDTFLSNYCVGFLLRVLSKTDVIENSEIIEVIEPLLYFTKSLATPFDEIKTRSLSILARLSHRDGLLKRMDELMIMKICVDLVNKDIDSSEEIVRAGMFILLNVSLLLDRPGGVWINYNVIECVESVLKRSSSYEEDILVIISELLSNLSKINKLQKPIIDHCLKYLLDMLENNSIYREEFFEFSVSILVNLCLLVDNVPSVFLTKRDKFVNIIIFLLKKYISSKKEIVSGCLCVLNRIYCTTTLTSVDDAKHTIECFLHSEFSNSVIISGFPSTNFFVNVIESISNTCSDLITSIIKSGGIELLLGILDNVLKNPNYCSRNSSSLLSIEGSTSQNSLLLSSANSSVTGSISTISSNIDFSTFFIRNEVLTLTNNCISTLSRFVKRLDEQNKSSYNSEDSVLYKCLTGILKKYLDTAENIALTSFGDFNDPEIFFICSSCYKILKYLDFNENNEVFGALLNNARKLFPKENWEDMLL